MNIISSRKFWILTSIVMIVLGLTSILVYKPKPGIDFTGGTLVEFKLKDNASIPDVRKKISEINAGKETLVQQSGTNKYIIRTKSLEEGEYKSFENGLKTSFDGSIILRHESIGSSVGANLTRKAIFSILIASLLIIMYLAYAFRAVPRSVSSWAFGTIAIIALVHDLIFSFGLYTLLGHYFGYQIEAMTVVAALTLLGFSVHDTIVVFDRIRENIIKNPQLSLEENARVSVNQTFARSLNTSMTVVLVLVSMLLLGGSTIKPFVLMLIIGISIGTYSSIFVASPLLVYWYDLKKNKAKKS